MKICDYEGFEIHIPISGGKAGKGNNQTSTIQLRRGGCIIKQFRFNVDSKESQQKAIAKAKAYAIQNKQKPTILYFTNDIKAAKAALEITDAAEQGRATVKEKDL